MIIDCISDLHGHLPELRGGDLLIIAGDLTARDELKQWKAFYDWLHKQQYRQIVYIAGNHDGFLENICSSEEARTLPLEESDLAPSHIEYLRDNFFIFEGLKIYGMPWTPIFCNWHFMQDRVGMREKVAMIPDDVDILITHGPAYGILDRCLLSHKRDDFDHGGCHELAERLKSLKQLKLHVFGHIHEDYGFARSYIEDGNEVQTVLHVNASIMDIHYRPINETIRVILGEKEAILEEEND